VFIESSTRQSIQISCATLQFCDNAGLISSASLVITLSPENAMQGG
jgi:hypothetical protein